jgi:hypothetical protein
MRRGIEVRADFKYAAKDECAEHGLFVQYKMTVHGNNYVQDKFLSVDLALF